MKTLTTSNYALEVGGNIRKLRIINDWKQDVLAAKLGISKVAVSNIERGVVNLQLSRLQDLAVVFDVDVSVLVQSISLSYTLEGREK